MQAILDTLSSPFPASTARPTRTELDLEHTIRRGDTARALVYALNEVFDQTQVNAVFECYTEDPWSCMTLDNQDFTPYTDFMAASFGLSL